MTNTPNFELNRVSCTWSHVLGLESSDTSYMALAKVNAMNTKNTFKRKTLCQ
jgi:3-methyladenine DNA glycosylase AlkC